MPHCHDANVPPNRRIACDPRVPPDRSNHHGLVTTEAFEMPTPVSGISVDFGDLKAAHP